MFLRISLVTPKAKPINSDAGGALNFENAMGRSIRPLNGEDVSVVQKKYENIQLRQ